MILPQLPADSPLDVDTEDEREEQSDTVRRRSFSRTVLPWAALFAVASVAAFASTAYVDAVAFTGDDVTSVITVTR